MSFETISLLLSWSEMGALLAILFRLGATFALIANTQRELRRAIHHLGEVRATELGNDNAFGGRGSQLAYPSRKAWAEPESTIAPEDLAGFCPGGQILNT